MAHLTVSIQSTLVLLFVAVLLAGCNADDISKLPEASGSVDFLAGSWSSCHNGGTDERETVFFDGRGNGTDTIIDYSSTDTTCSAGATPNPPMPFTYALGGPVSATLVGGVVTAYQWDYFFSGFSRYSIIYIDPAASPGVMYIGDLSGALDGTTPALRPNTLSTARIYLRQ